MFTLRIKFSMKNTENNDTFLLNLSILSTIIFILASLVSLSITLDEKGTLINGKHYFNNKQKLNIAFYNRIVILIAVSISLYVGYKNYESEKENTSAKYKSSLLLTTNILTIISAIIILYVAYLNRQEQTLTSSDVENPLI